MVRSPSKDVMNMRLPLDPPLLLVLKKNIEKSMKRKHLHCTPMDLVTSADAKKFIAKIANSQNHAELSHEIYQYSISFFYFCGVFRHRFF